MYVTCVQGASVPQEKHVYVALTASVAARVQAKWASVEVRDIIAACVCVQVVFHN